MKGFRSVFALRNKIGFLLAVKKAGGDAARKEDEEETKEVTVSLAKETSLDVSEAAVPSDLDGVFT